MSVVHTSEGLPPEWPDAAAVVQVNREREVDGVRTTTSHYYLSSYRGTGAEFAGWVQGRWNLETAFREALCFLGLETTRGWCRRTVLRAAPCLFGLYTVVALLYQALPESKRSGRVEWPGKVGVTFSDALPCVRRWLWREWVFPQAGGSGPVDQLPESLHKVLFYALAPAA